MQGDNIGIKAEEAGNKVPDYCFNYAFKKMQPDATINIYLFQDGRQIKKYQVPGSTRTFSAFLPEFYTAVLVLTSSRNFGTEEGPIVMGSGLKNKWVATGPSKIVKPGVLLIASVRENAQSRVILQAYDAEKIININEPPKISYTSSDGYNN